MNVLFAVVVSFNFNDRRYVLQPGAADGPAEFGRAWRASQSWVAAVAASLEVSHFYRGLRRLMAKAGLLPGPVTGVDVRDLAPRVDAGAYRRNLSAIAVEARRLGIPVLFLLLRDDPVQTDHLRKGIASLARADYETAIAELNFTARSPGMFADLARVYLARAYEAAGDPAKAGEAAVSRSVYRSFSGGTVIRLDTDYNDIMRQVAAEQGVPLVDAAKVLEEHPSAFIDFCHFNADGHRRVGELLAGEIGKILSRREARSPAPESRATRVAAASPR